MSTAQDYRPGIVAQLVRIAAFQNPEFYRAQAMRLPTYGKPRIISCAELHPRHVALPRGCLDEAIELIRSNDATPQISDERQRGTSLAVSFLGELHDVQAAAVAALEPHAFGVLAATTAFGKTVVGAKMIAARGLNTLVLVHRRQLVDQWHERLRTFLSIDAAGIGTIGGGKRKPTKRVDIALIQSLVRNGEVSDLVGDYGHLIVDECHISLLPASSWSPGGRRLGTCSGSLPRSRARTGTIPSSSCSAGPSAIASMRGRRLPHAPSATRSRSGRPGSG
jgi:hypothetical protein